MTIDKILEAQSWAGIANLGGNGSIRAQELLDDFFLNNADEVLELCYKHIRAYQSEELAKAIFAAAFKIGFSHGGSHAVAHEWGTHCCLPETPEECWKADIAWRIDGTEPDSDCHLDIGKVNDWNKVEP